MRSWPHMEVTWIYACFAGAMKLHLHLWEGMKNNTTHSVAQHHVGWGTHHQALARMAVYLHAVSYKVYEISHPLNN